MHIYENENYELLKKKKEKVTEVKKVWHNKECCLEQ